MQRLLRLAGVRSFLIWICCGAGVYNSSPYTAAGRFRVYSDNQRTIYHQTPSGGVNSLMRPVYTPVEGGRRGLWKR
jgi:hypothetical protein